MEEWEDPREQGGSGGNIQDTKNGSYTFGILQTTIKLISKDKYDLPNILLSRHIYTNLFTTQSSVP